jgi:hypothetical protein
MYVWLDLQKTGYGFGNGSLRSLAILVLRPVEPSPPASSPSVRAAALDGGARHLRPQQEGVVFAISGRHGHSTRFASVATPGYGEGPERYSVFHPNYGFVPVVAAPVLDWHDGDGGEANGRNFRRRRSSLPLVLSLWRWPLHKLIHNKTSLIQSVAVHAILAGGGPR